MSIIETELADPRESVNPRIVTERTTVHSLEELYDHLANGWDVAFADHKRLVWELERLKLED